MSVSKDPKKTEDKGIKPHFLINISSDTENLYGVRFFSSFFKNGSECDVTLFHISRLDSRDSSASLMEIWKGPEDSVLSSLNKSAQKALSRARRNLKSNAVTISEMKTKTVQERYGKVKDIIGEGSAGLYDAMVLGCRATYALQWLFDRPGDEIPKALIQDTTLSCPLWVCKEPEEGRENILLCVDGSESSMRAADHVGYILNHTPDHKVTVFHVATAADDKSQEIIESAAKILRSHNIAEDRIDKKTGWGVSLANVILAEKNRGRYAVIAMGVRGNQKGSLLGTIGMGGDTAATLIGKISKAALWIIP